MIKIKFKDWMYMNTGIILIACATYFFLVPNKFVTGGMTGLATILGSITPLSTSTWLICLNICMLVIGFIFLGKKTGIWTVYCSLGYSSIMLLFEEIFPMETTLTDEAFMELCVKYGWFGPSATNGDDQKASMSKFVFSDYQGAPKIDMLLDGSYWYNEATEGDNYFQMLEDQK